MLTAISSSMNWSRVSGSWRSRRADGKDNLQGRHGLLSALAALSIWSAISFRFTRAFSISYAPCHWV